MIWIYGFSMLVIGWFFALIGWSGWRENSPRPLMLGALGLAATSAVSFLAISGTLNGHFSWLVPVVPIGLAVAATCSVIRWGRLPGTPDPGRAERFDERNHMFARANLKHHPELAARHYRHHPEHREPDGVVHDLPELGEPGSTYHDPVFGGIADAAFSILDRSYIPLRQRTRGTVSPPKPDTLASAIRLLARRYGAADVGFIRTRPHHWYSHAGRQARNWGEAIPPEHPFGIVVVIPMDPNILRHAPALPVLLESSRGYVEGAKIAHLLAEYLSRFGFQATAHVDGNYQVICAPMAQEASLGHIGRMGIFMHHRLGPCVRLAVVTTDAELPESPPADHRYMEAFCRICLKCAENCPSRAISSDSRPPVSRGFAHWSIHQEKCYTFWRRIGTDCAVCIRSCPFTKPDTLLHKLARWYIRRNPLNRWIALKMDDILYGRKLRIPSRNPDLTRL